MTLRLTAIQELSNLIAEMRLDHPTRVAIDGRTACGKTTLADELAQQLRTAGLLVIRASLDGFHRPRSERYARGRHSPEGYYYDARDLGAVRSLLLDPLGNQGECWYRTASFDLEKDEPIDQPPLKALQNSVLLVDGTFLQRAELRGTWDLRIFVRSGPITALERGISRDAEAMGGEQSARELYAARYQPAYEIYESECRPEEIADIIFDNEDFDRPTVFRRGASL